MCISVLNYATWSPTQFPRAPSGAGHGEQICVWLTEVLNVNPHAP